MTVTAGNRTQLFQCYLLNLLCIVTTMILQNNISIFNFCPIESFYRWVHYFGEPKQQKQYWLSQQGIEHSFFILSFEMALTLSLHWFHKKTILDSTYVQLKVFVAECVTLGTHDKQKHLWMSQQGTENSVFRVIFKIGSDIITPMILYI